MMGDGVIDITSVRSAVEAQGFAGYSEIEIFSNDWWNKPMDEVLEDLHRAAPDCGLAGACVSRALAVSSTDDVVSQLYWCAPFFK
jgi:hypothetical protein